MTFDISITGRAPGKVLDPTAAYYAAFKRRHGFADNEMRGRVITAPNVVTVRPIGDYLDGADAGKYAVGGSPGRPAISRLRSGGHADAVLDRAIGAAALVNELRNLLERIRPRAARLSSEAIRDAIADAENVLRGLDAVAKGYDKIDVLRSLVRVLSRHA